MELGYSVNETSEMGLTPLHAASAAGNVGAMLMLLELQADLHAKDNLGYTALQWAARYGQVTSVKHTTSSGRPAGPYR